MAISFVQSANNTAASGTTLTITLGSSTTAGNCLVVCALGGGSSNHAVSGMTLGGSAGNFASLVTSVGTTSTTASILDIWADPNCTGGQTSVVVTWSSSNSNGLEVFVYEFSGIATSSILDKSSTAFTTTTNATFSSGTTATTTQASELWFGGNGGYASTTTGPSSPWNNSSQISSGSGPKTLMAGYQIVSATGTATYSGSYSPNSYSEAAVVALKAAAGGGGGGGSPAPSLLMNSLP